MSRRSLAHSVAWNLLLLTAGSVVFSIGINSLVAHNSFITGGGLRCGPAPLDNRIALSPVLVSADQYQNLQLKKLESIVFSVDKLALFIVENSFKVIGSNSGKRKIY